MKITTVNKFVDLIAVRKNSNRQHPENYNRFHIQFWPRIKSGYLCDKFNGGNTFPKTVISRGGWFSVLR